MTDLTREGLVEQQEAIGNLTMLAARCQSIVRGERYQKVRALDDDLYRAFHGKEPFNSARVPHYHASIDAAETLIPYDMSYEVRRSGTGDAGQATVWDPMRAVGEAEWRVTGCSNPALALSAAACLARARAMEAGRG